MRCRKKIKGYEKEFKQAMQEDREVTGHVYCHRCNKYQLKIKFFAFNRDKFRCQSCNIRYHELDHETEQLTIHHKIAKCNGNSFKIETLRNVITWCWKCHTKYNKTHPNQYIIIKQDAVVS